jgi:hypothetical protein
VLVAADEFVERVDAVGMRGTGRAIAGTIKFLPLGFQTRHPSPPHRAWSFRPDVFRVNTANANWRDDGTEPTGLPLLSADTVPNGYTVNEPDPVVHCAVGRPGIDPVVLASGRLEGLAPLQRRDAALTVYPLWSVPSPNHHARRHPNGHGRHEAPAWWSLFSPEAKAMKVDGIIPLRMALRALHR